MDHPVATQEQLNSTRGSDPSWQAHDAKGEALDNTASPPEAMSSPNHQLLVNGSEHEVFAKARLRLEAHSRIWRDRPLVRSIYEGYHRMIDQARSRAPGVDLEVGSGTGSYADYRPETLVCDLVPCPWLDLAADAARLPLADESIANLIMVDVLHHIAETRRFFDEVTRTLAPCGRLIMIEPYSSPVSWLAWRFVHEEDIDMAARPLDDPASHGVDVCKDPWSANIAVPTLLFWRDIDQFRSLYPQLRVVSRERFDFVVMPLSGGFEHRRLIPMFAVPPARFVERCLKPLAACLAFRCMIVLEKAC